MKAKAREEDFQRGGGGGGILGTSSRKMLNANMSVIAVSTLQIITGVTFVIYNLKSPYSSTFIKVDLIRMFFFYFKKAASHANVYGVIKWLKTT